MLVRRARLPGNLAGAQAQALREMAPADAPLRWPAQALGRSLEALLPGLSLEIVPEIDSTNTELMRRCRGGRCEPVLLVAERQLAGRGRLGRSWHSPPGSSLTFTLGLPLQPHDWSGLSLAVGVSLAEALAERTGCDLRIKWPNDLWLERGKLAGILIETAACAQGRYAVVGVGINLREPAPTWRPPGPQPDASAWPAVDPAWLGSVADINAPQALAAVAPALLRDVLLFERQGWGAFAQAFARRDLLAGRPVRLSDGRIGVACGIGPSGDLRLQTDRGLQEISSGEVSVRPQD